MGFPNDVKTFTAKTDNVDEIQAVDVNELQTEVTAIETELGTNPKGSAASVKERIEAAEEAIVDIENSAITALTGDVIASGPGSVAATIANKAVTLAKMADMATASLLGRNSSGIGIPEVLSKAIVKTMLDLSGTNTGDQTISLTGDVTGSGTGSFAATIANNAVTLAKMATMATASFLGRNTSGSGNPEVLSKATAKAMLDLSGTNTGDQAGYGLTPLTTPLTSTSWNGDAYSTTSKTLIDLSSVFGAPAGIKAAIFMIGICDSSSAANDCFLILSPNNTNNQGITVRCSGLANGKYTNVGVVVPCNANGDVYYQIKASGTSTLNAYLEIWGYWY